MTNKENQEFLQLIPISEKWSVNRLKLIIEFAKLKDISVAKVMKQLKISPPPTIHA